MGIMGGLMAGMGVLQAGSQIMQGFQAKQASENEAEMYQRQAQEANMQASGKIVSDDYRAIQVMNRIAVGTAASGFTPGGSAKYVRNESVEEARLNDMYTRYSGKLAATSDIYAANTAQWQGQQALMKGFIGAAATGASTGMGMYKGMKLGDWGQDSLSA